jgi:methyl-accepting chemotaxis protein
MKFKSIQLKIAVVAGLCLLVAVGAVVGYGLFASGQTREFTQERVSALQTETALDGLKALAGEKAGLLKAEFELALDAARTMAQTFEVVKQTDGDGRAKMVMNRDQFNAVLFNVLKKNPKFNGTYSCWEPDAFDGKDAMFRTGENGNNAVTGRFTPYWTRDTSGRIDVQPLVEYDSRARHPNGVPKGGWYIGPKENRTESVLGPLPYIVQGRQVWLATMSVPIIVDGTFYGVAGADYDLSFVQKLCEQVDSDFMDGQGDVTVVSDFGLVVGSSENPDMIGKHMKNLFPETWEEGLQVIGSGKSRASIESKTGMATAYASISLGDTGRPWGAVIRVPESVVLAQVNQLSGRLQERGADSALWQTVVSVGIGLAAVVVMWFAAGGIARPIRSAAQLAGTIRDGDFSRRMNLDSRDEVGQLGGALDEMADSLQKAAGVAEQIAGGNLAVDVTLASDRDQLGKALQAMTTSLNRILGRVQSAAEQIASGSSQVSDSSQSLSQGATQSASSLEEITSSMSEMASQTRLNAENATQASTLAGDARKSARNGNKQMKQMVAAMGEINEAGQSISKIIKVIDEIAFQTNLLALNAAVEAARAGQHGKGFAVVAEEVRNLAARSAKAASETAELIEGSVKKAENGADIADRTAAALEEIVSGITRATDLVGEIAAASNEQAQGIGQVNQGLGQIDQVTQQNTANAEESAAASEELSGQAEELRRLLTRFRLKEGTGQALKPGAGVSKPRSFEAAAPLSSPPREEARTWGDNGDSPAVSGVARPEEVIALDDDEFGKY